MLEDYKKYSRSQTCLSHLARPLAASDNAWRARHAFLILPDLAPRLLDIKHIAPPLLHSKKTAPRARHAYYVHYLTNAALPATVRSKSIEALAFSKQYTHL